MFHATSRHMLTWILLDLTASNITTYLLTYYIVAFMALFGSLTLFRLLVVNDYSVWCQSDTRWYHEYDWQCCVVSMTLCYTRLYSTGWMCNHLIFFSIPLKQSYLCGNNLTAANVYCLYRLQTKTTDNTHSLWVHTVAISNVGQIEWVKFLSLILWCDCSVTVPLLDEGGEGRREEAVDPPLPTSPLLPLPWNDSTAT